MTPDDIRARLRDGLAMVWTLGCEPPIELADYTTYRTLLDEEVDRALTSLVLAIGSRVRVCRRQGVTRWESSRRAPTVVVWLADKVAWRQDFAERVDTIAMTGQVMGVMLVSTGQLPISLRSRVIPW